jgi:hypothetical protein
MESAPRMLESELNFPASVSWPDVPSFGPSLAIGSDYPSMASEALRLRDVIRELRAGSANLHSAVAVLHGSDSQLRRLARSEGSIGPRLRERGVAVVVGPGFSTWWASSPFDSLVMTAYSAHFAVVLARSLPSIPTVVWRTGRDLERWTTWLSQKRVQAFAVDLGTLRHQRPWRWAMEGVSFMSEQLASSGSAPRLIVNGPATIERLVDVRARWHGELTFASQSPYCLARGGKRLRDDLGWVPDEAPFSELERDNRDIFERTANRIVHLPACADAKTESVSPGPLHQTPVR